MSPERRGGRPRKEEEPSSSYYRAARFTGEEPAGHAYVQAQEAIFNSEHDLSVYRFQLQQLWHVAVLGQKPPEDFDQLIQGILAAGEATSLPPDILKFLQERRKQAPKRL
ncbi:MAG: hypothetical protein AMXMBFR16_13100 [Candidatus Uhrbacteria bacterium]